MIDANLINKYQLNELLEYQSNLESRVPLGRITVELGFVKEEEFAPFLASYFNVPYLNLKEYFTVQKEALDIVPKAIAKRLNILPVLKEDDTLTVATSDPLDLPVFENLQNLTRCSIKRVVSPANQIREGIDFYYSGGFSSYRHSKEYLNNIPKKKFNQMNKYRWPSVSSLIRLFIEKAHKNSVSLIHIQPDKNRIEILFRVDKKLEKIASYPKTALSSLSEFIKRAAKLDFETQDIPQSGYFKFNSNSINMEIGVSILPTLSGERILLEVPRRVGWSDEETWLKPV